MPTARDPLLASQVEPDPSVRKQVALLSTWLLPKEIEETHEKDKTHHDEAWQLQAAATLMRLRFTGFTDT